jgi:hypothetical protein
LAGAITATEAIRLGTADAWRDLERIIDRHNVIRAAQSTTMSHYFSSAVLPAQTNFSSEPLASDLQLCNLDEIWPNWRNPTARTYKVHGPQDRLEPWPADPAEQLVWLVSSGAAPWLPTVGDLEQLNAARHNEDVPRPTPQLPWRTAPFMDDDHKDELTYNNLAFEG